MEAPAYFASRPTWLSTPLEEELFVSETRERPEDVRAGNIFYDYQRPVHERSANWMNDVPQTRYDQLYGVNHPDIPKIGVRRHLDTEYVNRKEVLERDAAIMRKTVSGARRLRHKAEIASTHRNAAV
jgi:hypothetical protein